MLSKLLSLAFAASLVALTAGCDAPTPDDGESIPAGDLGAVPLGPETLCTTCTTSLDTTTAATTTGCGFECCSNADCATNERCSLHSCVPVICTPSTCIPTSVNNTNHTCTQTFAPDGTFTSTTCVVCNGSGSTREANSGAQGPNCTAGATTCSGADTCDGSGNCLANDYGAGTFTSTCMQCDGSGTNVAVGSGSTQAGHCDGAATTCSGADSCDGAGHCNLNDVAPGTVTETCMQCDGSGHDVAVPNGQQQAGHCDAPGSTCTAAAVCNGSGTCLATNLPAGAPTTTTCKECDGMGAVRNVAAGTMQPTLCDDSGSTCSKGACDGSGACVQSNKDDATPCGDLSDLCVSQACQSGNCTQVSQVSCPSRECHTQAACNPPDGTCIDSPTPGDACGGDACFDQAGTCDGNGTCSATAKDCSSFATPCTDPACDPTTGCFASNKTNGTQCTPDACHAGNSCGSGVCGAPITCTPKGPCFTSTCNASSGCVDKPVASGMPCDPTDDCHEAGTCDATGACNAMAKADGTTCSASCSGGASGTCMAGACNCPDGTSTGTSMSTGSSMSTGASMATGSAASTGSSAGDTGDSGGCSASTESSSSRPLLPIGALLLGLAAFGRAARRRRS